MKTMAKVTALGVVALGLVASLNGCSEDPDKASLATTPGQAPVGKPVTPVGTARSSKEAYEQQQGNNPMMKSKDYRPK